MLIDTAGTEIVPESIESIEEKEMFGVYLESDIPEVEEEKANSLIRQADLIIATDFNDPKRVGMMGGMIVANSCPKLMIDHHLYPTDFASIAISFPQASSASEMVFRFVYQLQQSYNLPERLISNEVATCIYTGMMTDTGNFSYNSNDPALYQIVSKLLEKGVTKDVIYNNVFNQFSEDRMRLMGYCLHKKMRIFPEHHTAFISLTRKELYTFNFQSGDAEGIVNLPLQISGIPLVVMLVKIYYVKAKRNDISAYVLIIEGTYQCNWLNS